MADLILLPGFSLLGLALPDFFVDETNNGLVGQVKKAYPKSKVFWAGDGKSTVQISARDEIWLPIANRNGWITITRDVRIFDHHVTAKAVVHPNLRMVLFDEAGHTKKRGLGEMLDVVCADLLYYANFLQPPWVLRITRTTDVKPFTTKLQIQHPTEIVEEFLIKRQQKELWYNS